MRVSNGVMNIFSFKIYLIKSPYFCFAISEPLTSKVLQTLPSNKVTHKKHYTKHHKMVNNKVLPLEVDCQWSHPTTNDKSTNLWERYWRDYKLKIY